MRFISLISSEKSGAKICNLVPYLQDKLNLPVSILQITTETPLQSLLSKIVQDRQTVESLHYFNLVIGACFNLNNDTWNFSKNMRQSKTRKPIALNTTADPKSATIHMVKRWFKGLRNFKFTTSLYSQGALKLDTSKKIILGIGLLVFGFVFYFGYLNVSLRNYTNIYNSKKAIFDQIYEQANQTRELNKKIAELEAGGKKNLKEPVTIHSLLNTIVSLNRGPLKFTNITYEPTGNKITIIGDDFSNGAAAGKLLQSLQQLSNLINVRLEYLKETGNKTKSFKLTGESR